MRPKKSAKRFTQISKNQFLKALRHCSLASMACMGLVGGITGCNRAKYRCKTDNEVYYLLDEKRSESCEQNSALYRIDIDSRSRMYDPFNPDRQPMPEDDPASSRYMRKVDGKKGYPLWEANGRTNIVENPEWWSYLPLDERGVLVLNLNESVRTALLHSPDYQSSLEELYLSALDVSSERFLFDSQFFGGWQSSWQTDGPRRNNATTPNSSTVVSTGARNWAMNKQFATGADLVVGLANAITWQVAGPNDNSASTVLNFSLIQPLLRQGGRDVVLERLTLAERTLLANVRAFERYRRSFYLNIATGRNIDTQPRRRGGVFGGSGFGGFNALGGGFGTLGGGGGNFGGGGGAGVPGANGFLGLLQDQLQISNEMERVAQLTDVLLQLQDTYRELLLTIPNDQSEIPRQQLQVAQAQQDLFDFQTQLIQRQVTFQQTLDGFKADLGLPPYITVEINDPLLDQFKLISQELRDRRSSLAESRATVGDTNSAILDLSRVEKDPRTQDTIRLLASSDALRQNLTQLNEQLAYVQRLQQAILQMDVPSVRQDIQRLREAIPLRKEQLQLLKDVVALEKNTVGSLLPTKALNTSFLDGTGLDELPGVLEEDLKKLQIRFRDQLAQLESLRDSILTTAGNLQDFTDDQQRFQAISEKSILASQDLIAQLSEDITSLQLVQARARTEAALLPEVDLDIRDAVEIARRNRRDWLNNRANLVNTWRAIEVVADTLESVLDFTVSGDVQNYGGNPLALRSTTGRLRVGLQWDAPITRLQERNNYRQILIEYARAKRTYYQFEDGIWTTMRGYLRTLRQNQLTFEIQRFAVQTAAEQISVNADLRQINEALQQVNPTAARDATTAINALLQTQNLLIGTFVNYEALRRALDLDLGTMEVDAEGLWIDPGPIRLDTVGGSIGQAVVEYGLSESELRMLEQVETLPNQPLELAPSNQDVLPGLIPNQPVNPAPLPNFVPAPQTNFSPRRPTSNWSDPDRAVSAAQVRGTNPISAIPRGPTNTLPSSAYSPASGPAAQSRTAQSLPALTDL
ncbi:MAG: hypothetical protein KDB03_26530, partial [Planctomycetales bacterium]|nr:hypothetical protein [Planctomycetales bacterium]